MDPEKLAPATDVILDTPPWDEWLTLTSGWPPDEQQKFLATLKAEAADLFQGTPDITLEAAQTDAILNLLFKSTSTKLEKAVQHAFRNALHQGHDSLRWKAAMPSYRLSVEHLKTTIDPKIFALRDCANRIADRLQKELIAVSSSTPATVAGAVLASAALFGGMSRWEDIESLFYCEDFVSEGGIVRGRFKNSEGKFERIWFVDGYTELLLLKFRSNNGLPVAAKNKEKPDNASTCKDALRAVAEAIKIKKDDRELFCNRLTALGLSRSMTTVPGYQLAYLSQRQTVTSSSDGEWTTFLTGRFVESRTDSAESRQPQSAEHEDSHVEPPTSVPVETLISDNVQGDEYSGRGRQIYKVLKALCAQGSSLTILDACNQLRTLSTSSSAWPIETLLKEWTIDQLERARKARGSPATVLRYFCTLCHPLIAAAGDFDFTEVDELSLISMFNFALGSVESESEAYRLTRRLRAFYPFLRQQFPELPAKLDFREIENAVWTKTSRVKTRFAFERDYLNARAALVDARSPRKLNRRRLARIAGMIAYRLGLRKTEIANLSIQDFWDGPYPILMVRPSQWGRLKSVESVRPLPLLAFLDADELDELRAFVAERKSIGIPTDALLTDLENGRPLSGATLINPFIEELRRLSGDSSLTAHSLRHGFVNLTLLRCHIAEGLTFPSEIDSLQCDRYKRSSCLEMCQHLMQRMIGDALDFQWLFAISRLVGHLSPATTLRNYIHVLELITHRMRVREAAIITIAQAAAIYGVTPQRFYQILEEKKVPVDSANLTTLMPIFRERLGSFPSTELLAVPPETPPIKEPEKVSDIQFKEEKAKRMAMIADFLRAIPNSAGGELPE